MLFAKSLQPFTQIREANEQRKNRKKRNEKGRTVDVRWQRLDTICNLIHHTTEKLRKSNAQMIIIMAKSTRHTAWHRGGAAEWEDKVEWRRRRRRKITSPTHGIHMLWRWFKADEMNRIKYICNGRAQITSQGHGGRTGHNNAVRLLFMTSFSHWLRVAPVTHLPFRKLFNSCASAQSTRHISRTFRMPN